MDNTKIEDKKEQEKENPGSETEVNSQVDSPSTTNVQEEDTTVDKDTPQKQNTSEKSPDGKKTKIDVLLKAAGDAPIMKKKKWAVDANKPIAYLIEFIRKYIKCEPSESLFLYVNQTFTPSPDQILSNLFECFGSDGKLVLHYCKSEAWG